VTILIKENKNMYEGRIIYSLSNPIKGPYLIDEEPQRKPDKELLSIIRSDTPDKIPQYLRGIVASQEAIRKQTLYELRSLAGLTPQKRAGAGKGSEIRSTVEEKEQKEGMDKLRQLMGLKYRGN
jgi:hypothetical protein